MANLDFTELTQAQQDMVVCAHILGKVHGHMHTIMALTKRGWVVRDSDGYWLSAEGMNAYGAYLAEQPDPKPRGKYTPAEQASIEAAHPPASAAAPETHTDSPSYGGKPDIGMEILLSAMRDDAQPAPETDVLLEINGVPMTSEAQIVETVTEFALRSSYGAIVGEVERERDEARAERDDLRAAGKRAVEVMDELGNALLWDFGPPDLEREFSEALQALDALTDADKETPDGR